MFCIVLYFYYLCVVKGDKPVISAHKSSFKYSQLNNNNLRFTSPFARSALPFEHGEGKRNKKFSHENLI